MKDDSWCAFCCAACGVTAVGTSVRSAGATVMPKGAAKLLMDHSGTALSHKLSDVSYAYTALAA
jgi:hypothetical protein